MVERWPFKPMVVGSIPTEGAFLFSILPNYTVHSKPQSYLFSVELFEWLWLSTPPRPDQKQIVFFFHFGSLHFENLFPSASYIKLYKILHFENNYNYKKIITYSTYDSRVVPHHSTR